jgi:hypothetical protein
VRIHAQRAARRVRTRTVGDVLPRSRIHRLAALIAGLVGAGWARPVPGPVTRAFDVHGSPFAAGLHRGVDLAASAGAAVGAPCSGRVVAAGRVGASGRLVTVACGPWHATVLPLASVAVRRGGHVRTGRLVGTVAAARGAHAGLHLGVRRASARFGYVDPLRFLPPAHPWAPPVAPRGGRVRRARASAATASARAAAAPPAPAPTPARAAAPRPAASPPRAVAPWPVWAGAALMLAGAGTGGVLRGRRRRSACGLARVAPRTSTPPGGGWGG